MTRPDPSGRQPVIETHWQRSGGLAEDAAVPGDVNEGDAEIRAGWTFDDYFRYDQTPTTGAKSLTWVARCIGLGH